jgi:hypothetical protein
LASTQCFLGSSRFFVILLLSNDSLVGILILIYNTAGSASLIMSAAFKRKESAVTLAPLFLLTSQLFCGFIVNLNQIPAWIAKIQYLSYVKYAY